MLSGLLAGYYHVTVRVESDRSRTVSRALEFVNSLLRHDLRNDLATIQGQAELLSLEDHDTASGSTDAAVISRKAEEALARIDTTRTITDTVVGEPEFESVDLVGVVEEMVETAEDVYDVSIETKLPEEAFVSANEGLRSVVDNVLEHAIEHNDADDPSVTMDVEIDSTADTVRLSVSDNGPGIPDEQKHRLLTTAGAESGAGLTIVKSLVLAYDGDLRIEDNQPQGAVFVVELPLARRQ